MLKAIKKKEFWISVLLVIISYLILYFLFFKFLSFYTRHGQSVEVPKLTELKFAEAQTKISEAGLSVEVSDSLYDPNLPPLTVISQVPAGKAKVKPGRKIYVTLNRVIPPMVKFPEGVTGGSVYQAKLRLEGYKLSVEKIRTVYGQFTDLVMSVEYKGKVIKPGESIPQGSGLVLVVSKGTGKDKVPIPNLVGKNYHEAISELYSIGLMPEYNFDPGSGEPDGTVFRQSPRYEDDDSLLFGATITLFISGPQPKEGLEGIFFENNDKGDSKKGKSDPKKEEDDSNG